MCSDGRGRRLSAPCGRQRDYAQQFFRIATQGDTTKQRECREQQRISLKNFGTWRSQLKRESIAGVNSLHAPDQLNTIRLVPHDV